MSTQNSYNERPSVAMNPLSHEIAPMGDIWECTGCNEIFFTLDAADNHEKSNQATF